MSARFTFEPALEIDGAEARRALGLIEVVQGDITAAAVDAIVNAANEALAGGGGVDGAIHAAAGPGLSGACRALPEVRPGVRCPTGEARITPGFRLPARHVIHTVGPVWHGGQRGEPELLASCYRRSVQLAAEHSLETLAFPAISTGIFGYPLESAARVSVSALANALGATASIRAVQLIAFGEPTASVLRATLNRAREVVGTEGTATDAAHDGAQPALTPEVAVVNAWLAASNAADVERVLAVCAPDVELVGPRGTLRGREALRAWLGRANATFESRRVFQRGEEVVVEQHGTWRTPAGELQGEASVASRFSVRAGLITRIQRHETLAEALAHAGIEPALQPG